jgi:predicted nucleotidyltransferase component of viral defense system
MIDAQSLLIWREKAPWVDSVQVEQDLVITRALVDIYNHPLLRKELIFRGGTALQKCFFNTPMRYSEDLDFVQINQGVIGPISNALHDTLNPWLGQPKVKRWAERVTFIYRFKSSGQDQPIRLKLEINTKEHYNFLDLIEIPFALDTDWYSGKTTINTYQIDELMATKLRALFQRKKGRDLFDIARYIEALSLNVESVLRCFRDYLDRDSIKISRADFEKNLYLKRELNAFREDILPLLPNNSLHSFDKDFDLVMNTVITKLPGEPWKGTGSN